MKGYPYLRIYGIPWLRFRYIRDAARAQPRVKSALGAGGVPLGETTAVVSIDARAGFSSSAP